MKLNSLLYIVLLGLIFYSCSRTIQYDINHPMAADVPRNYVIYKIADSIDIDGVPSERSWENAEWSEPFVDIRGKEQALPYLETKFKMLWSNDYLYVYSQMEEPHIWGKITERDAVVFQDDDFEIFIDPDGDGHNYTEIEVNALNTVWDLFLHAPYGFHNRNKVLWHWDIRELLTAVHIEGTINNPSDNDKYWAVEMAIPINMLNEFAGDQKAAEGSEWRINFSRVDWQMEVIEGKYEKELDEKSNLLPENNWSWSPQGKVAMHLPEKWGYVQFSDLRVGSGKVDFQKDSDYQIKQALYEIFHHLEAVYTEKKIYPQKVKVEFMTNNGFCDSNFNYDSMKHRYEISYLSCKTNIIWVINEEGRLYSRLPSKTGLNLINLN